MKEANKSRINRPPLVVVVDAAEQFHIAVKLHGACSRENLSKGACRLAIGSKTTIATVVVVVVVIAIGTR